MIILLRFIVGIIQFSAIISGMEAWWGIHWFFSGFIALALCVFCWPLAMIVGFIGAVTAWGLSWWGAALLFFPFLLLAIVIGTGALSLMGLKKLINHD